MDMRNLGESWDGTTVNLDNKGRFLLETFQPTNVPERFFKCGHLHVKDP